MLFLIWTGVLIGVIYIYLRRAHSRFTPYDVKQLPPLPFIGNVLPLILRKIHFVEDLSRYYDSFPEERFIGKYEFTNPVIIVRDLELIKKITIKDFEYFLDHRAFTDEKVEPIFARNLFSLRGDEWKDMRSTLSPAFTSSKIRVMVPFMEEVGNQMMAALKKQIKANGGQPVEIDCRDLTRRYANDVIATCAFGLKVDSHADGDTKFFEMGRNAAEFKMRQMIMFFAYSAFPTFVKWMKMTLFSKETTSFFRSLVIDTMRNREAHNILRPDMIHLLMEAKKGHLNHDETSKERDAGFATVEESAVGKKHINRTWSDNDLIAQAVLFFIAGFETVSSAMSFAIRELALHKDIQDRLAKDIREDFNKNNGKIDYTSIQNLPYLDNVISEVLRLWTPGFQLDRICTKPYNLGKPNKNSQKDYILQKGDQLIIPVWCIHRNPKYFPDPEKFDPERFADDKKDLIKPMTYMPFGIGPRNCIGSRFALLELKMLIYQILLHMEVLPSERTVLETVFSKNTFNLNLEGGFLLNFNIRGSTA
ncbi:cytochrome P450 9e2-like [Pieris brassicae]|uniref:cytochrome P450 9e2-like n=1 Tax=Pieris brassicae TaxID=7116 RepID=UPI001E65E4C2|nr:cytochrome P450 9e2-like [Pieris brassicae]